VKKETASVLQVLGVVALGAATVMVMKRRSEGDDEEVSVSGSGTSTETYLRGLPDDELERLIIDARKAVYSAKVDVGEYRSDKLVKFDPEEKMFVDCEGERVPGVVAVKPATAAETEGYEECEDEVAEEKAG